MARLTSRDATLRTLAEVTPHLLYSVDLKDRFIYANEKLCTLINRPEEEILGKKADEILRAEGADVGFGTDRDTLLEGKSVTRSVVLAGADGAYRTYDAVRAPLCSEENVVGLAVLCRDTTEQRRIEGELRFGRHLLDCAGDAIIVRDTDDNIVFWSRGAERLYGFSAQEMVGSKTSTLTAKNESDAKTIAKMISAEDEWSGELQNKRRDGSEITVQSRRSTLRDENGNTTGVLLIESDITEKKNLERQYLRAQRMECLGTLAAGITHDLNNILAPIILGADTLRRKATDPSELRLLDTIAASAKRGADIIKEVLSFARGIDGKRVAVQIRHLVKELEKIVSETFPRTISFVSDIPQDLWAVSADATQIHQVLLNLSINAKDAMPHGGKLEIKARNVLLDDQYVRMNIEAKKGPHVMLTVSDTGYGIPGDIIDKIFEPFFTTKKVGEGTGLGLSTVQSIVKSHGGFLKVYSEPNKGSEFHVYLPAQLAKANGVNLSEQDMLPRGNGELILVVEDETAIRDITKFTLEAHGYRVMTASDGTEALSLYAQHQADIAALVTDIVMPYMDGFALLRALRKMKPGLKVIAMSGMLQDHQLAQQVGATAYIHKPFTASTLLTTLREALEIQK